MRVCYACGTPWGEKHEPGRGENCMSCGADMHCCLNCKMYDPMKAYQCASRTAEPPTDKASANSCDEFMMADRKAGEIPSPGERKKKALKDKWDSLFKS